MTNKPLDSLKVLMEIRKRMSELFSEGLNQFEVYSQLPEGVPRWNPPFDLIETEDSFVIYGELPGIYKDDLALQLTGSELTIAGERRPETPENTKACHLAERDYGTFSRSFRLPDQIEEKQIATSLKEGLLEIRLPKKKPRSIPIK